MLSYVDCPPELNISVQLYAPLKASMKIYKSHASHGRRLQSSIDHDQHIYSSPWKILPRPGDITHSGLFECDTFKLLN